MSSPTARTLALGGLLALGCGAPVPVDQPPQAEALPHSLRRIYLENEADRFASLELYVFTWRDQECITRGFSDSPIVCTPVAAGPVEKP